MKIVVGFVDRPESEAALDRAVEEAKLRDAELIVIHSTKGGERDETEHAIAYRDILDRVEEELESAGVTYEVRQFVRGKTPAEDLVAVADNEGADLIVIGLRRRSPVGKLILGSHAQDVLLSTDVPVLCVPAGSEFDA
ncbi:MAG: universal stress protein [Nitriliruptorales bacterium]|nr:universal stress protein [Nitriliruptorales bacterium]